LTPDPYRLAVDAPPNAATSAYEENLARAAGNLSEKSIEAKEASVSARAGAHASNTIMGGIAKNLGCHRIACLCRGSMVSTPFRSTCDGITHGRTNLGMEIAFR
jgi:hypothetical protein